MTRRFVGLLSVLTIALFTLPGRAEPPKYRLRLLPQATRSAAWGINETGQIVGAGDFGIDFQPQPFVYDSVTGVMTNLGELTGIPGVAEGINESGNVVGWSYNGGYRSFVFDGSGVTFVDPTEVGYQQAMAVSINDAGQIAGTLMSMDNQPRELGFVFDGEALHTFAGFGGNPIGVRSINNSGVLAGASSPDGVLWRPFKYENGVMADLIGLTNPTAQGNAFHINDLGVAVGLYWEGDGEWQAARFADDQVELLGTLSEPGFPQASSAQSVNDLGVVVGASNVAGTSYQHGFVHIDGAMYDLNDYVVNLGDFTIITANDINNLGQIVGSGESSSLGTRAFLLTPVPEPATVALAAVGVLAIAARRKQGRGGRQSDE